MGKGILAENELSFFEKKARLEVSGISKSTPSNSINMRIGQKKKQSKKSDITELPCWIIVVEFDTPQSKIIKR